MSRAYISRLLIERHWFTTAHGKRRIYRHPRRGYELRIRWLGVSLWFDRVRWRGMRGALQAALRIRDNMVRRHWRRAPEQARRYLAREGLAP